MRVYDNPHYILKTNISTPSTRHTTYQQEPKMKRNLDLSRYKIQKIPSYMHKTKKSPQKKMPPQPQIDSYSLNMQQ